jgi:asparagine synthetase B (glutamine-hydrolysing)
VGAIAGWVSATPRDETALARMLERLAHRSGDLSGFVDRRRTCQVVFGTNLYDAQSRIAVVLDGAISNRDELRPWLAKRGLQAKNDPELLLRAYQYWDKDAIKHLRGGFAFAIWDGRKERLLLARDRFGEKPLYLRESNGALLFASEAKALADGDAEVDLEAVWEHLACRYVPGPRTLLKGIRKLPPASYALWHFGKLRETRYWVAPDQKPSFDEPSNVDPVDGFIERLGEAVSYPCRPAYFSPEESTPRRSSRSPPKAAPRSPPSPRASPRTRRASCPRRRRPPNISVRSILN